MLEIGEFKRFNISYIFLTCCAFKLFLISLSNLKSSNQIIKLIVDRIYVSYKCFQDNIINNIVYLLLFSCLKQKWEKKCLCKPSMFD